MKQLYIKKSFKIGLLLILVFVLTACNFGTRRSYTFEVETGDNIKVTLDNIDKYSLSQKNGTFIVSKDDQTISQGVFLTDEMYNQYKDLIDKNENNVILNKETGKKDDNEYIYYETKGKSGTEYNYVVMINDSHTGVIIGSTVSKEEAQNVFDLLTLTYDIWVSK